MFHRNTRPPSWRSRTSRSQTRRRRIPLGAERLELRMLLAAGLTVSDYQFNNHGLNGMTELFSSDTHLQSVASDISSPLALGSTGNGDPARGLALGGAWNETTEPTPAGGQPDYFTFSITPTVGNTLSLAELSFQVRRNDQDSKNSYSVYFDEDPGSGGNNYSTRLVTGSVTTEDVFDRIIVSLEGNPALVNRTMPVTFRYYAWGTAGVGTQRIDNIRVRVVQESASESALAYYGDAGRLIHPLDEQGNRIADFSAAGYRYGNEPIPDVTQTIDASRVINVSPVAGDDMASLQAAVDQVSAMTPDANGFRGIVQLSAGEFQISNQISILESGVVLRGVGDGVDTASNTVLRGTGTSQRSLIVVGQGSGFASGISNTTHSIVDKYVPVGATSFRVDSTTNWSVGDEVIVRRPSTANWIAAIGMDSIPPRSDGSPIEQWVPGSRYDHFYEREIMRIEGDRIFLNSPLMNSFEQQFGGGTVFRYTFPRIHDVGVEHIRGVSDFVSDTDEDHLSTFIELRSVEDAWVTDVTGQHLVYATVHATSRSRRVTVDGATSLDPKSIITGARRYPFTIDGQFVLMKNLFSEEGRHDFVNNASTRNRGPNVFLNGTAVNSHSSTGPHQRWSSGTLYDTITTDSMIEARNRGNFGSGHGWGGANMVFWNTVATDLIVQNPPTAQNWVIGSSGSLIDETRFGPQEMATVDAHETPIDFDDPNNPLSSLYVAQRNQQDGESALERREYVLGDYDLGVFDGAASVDSVPVDPGWQSQISTITSGLPVESFDRSTDGHFVPFSFDFQLGSGERVYSALLTLGLRGTGGNTTDDSLWIDSTVEAHSLASLGMTVSLPTDATSPLTIELVGSDLAALNDGLLNLAVSENTNVDWATLDMRVGLVAVDAVNDNFSTIEDVDVVLDVLANDVGVLLQVQSFTQGTLGTVVDNGDGTLTYQPVANASGTDSFGYTVTDSSGETDTASVTVVIASDADDPVITWANPAGIAAGTPLSSSELNATSSVPGSFVYTPSAGATLNAGGGQTLSVMFTPIDTVNFNTVTATVLIDVSKLDPNITWPEPDDIAFGTPLSVTQLFATADVAGSFAYSPTYNSVLSAGDDQTLSLTFVPLDSLNYNTVTDAVTITVTKAIPLVTWEDPADITFGTALGPDELSAMADLPGTFQYDPPLDSLLNAGDGQTLTATFTPDEAENYSVITALVSVDVLKADPVITWDPQHRLAVGTALGDAQLNAMADVSGQFQYTPAAGTLLDAGRSQSVVVEFVPDASGNYHSATETQFFDLIAVGVSLVQSDSTTTVSESGTFDTVSVVLTDQPTARVAFQIDVSNPSEIGVQPSALAFDAGNWDTPQLIRVTGLPDLLDDGDQQAELSITLDHNLTADQLFLGVPEQIVSVTNADRMVDQFEVSIVAGRVQVRHGTSDDLLLDLPVGSQTPVDITTGGLSDTVVLSGLGSTEVINLQTAGGDDSIRVTDLGSSSIDAGAGLDRVLFEGLGQTVDLTTLTSRLQNVEIVETTSESMTLALDLDDVVAISGGDRLLALMAPRSRVQIRGDASYEFPTLESGKMHHMATRDGRVLEVVNSDAWRNPFDRFDVNRSGDVSALDALVVLNEMSRGGVRDLAQPETSADIGTFYYDSNEDSRISALDALVVINEMSRRDIQALGEQRVPQTPKFATFETADKGIQMVEANVVHKTSQQWLFSNVLEVKLKELVSDETASKRIALATDVALEDWLESPVAANVRSLLDFAWIESGKRS